MIGTFEAEFASITQQLGTASTTQTAAPAGPADQRYWRLIADWTLDSDQDGTPDWLEFEVAADPTHPDQGFADAFNADSDLDGMIDGLQRDSDRDGIRDIEDAGESDRTIDWRWEETPEPRYAVFEPSPPVTSGAPDAPVQVNDLGMVLYQRAVWFDGETRDLVTDTAKVSGCVAMGTNNLGHIVGRGNLAEGSTQIAPPYGRVLVIWKCLRNGGTLSWEDPRPVIITTPASETLGRPVWLVDPGNPREDFASDSLLDDHNRFVGDAETHVPGGSNPLRERSVWQWNETTGEFSHAAAPWEGVEYTLSPNLTWGPDVDRTKIFIGGQQTILDGAAWRLARRPNARLTALYGNAPPGVSWRAGNGRPPNGSGTPWMCRRPPGRSSGVGTRCPATGSALRNSPSTPRKSDLPGRTPRASKTSRPGVGCWERRWFPATTRPSRAVP